MQIHKLHITLTKRTDLDHPIVVGLQHPPSRCYTVHVNPAVVVTDLGRSLKGEGYILQYLRECNVFHDTQLEFLFFNKQPRKNQYHTCGVQKPAIT